MYRQLVIAKRKKAKSLQQKGWSVNKIAHHLVSNWSSVNRWIEMEEIGEDNRGWKKGRLRRYEKESEKRVINIRKRLRAEESYFFGPEVILANYRRCYPSKEPRSKLRGIKRQRLKGLTGVDPHAAA